MPTKQGKCYQYAKVAVNLLYAELETTGHRQTSPTCIKEGNKQALKVERPDRVVLEVCLDLLSVLVLRVVGFTGSPSVNARHSKRHLGGGCEGVFICCAEMSWSCFNVTGRHVRPSYALSYARGSPLAASIFHAWPERIRSCLVDVWMSGPEAERRRPSD